MLFVAMVSSSSFGNIFVAARVLAHHNLRARFLVSKYAAKAGRCFNSVISLRIDELSNYDRICTVILVSSFVFYKTVIATVKLMTISYPNPLQLLRARHTEKNRLRMLAFFSSHCVPKLRT